ncbi:MAG: leucine-rich repeat domain-containing protein [Clostridia bacterium]|nr:leucine-rich repeat domain-containing protein [Clostridia bacterium]
MDVLIHLAEEEYDFWLDNRLTMLQENAEFEAYLQDSLKGSSLGSASALAKYAEARQLEHEGQMEAAAEAYSSCLGFYDASLRYDALIEKIYDAYYTEANRHMKRGEYAVAYVMLCNLGKYRDSEDLAAAIEKQIGYAPTSAEDTLRNVTNLEVTRQGERKVEARWKKAAHAEVYKVYGRRSSRGQWHLLLSTRNDSATLRDDLLYAEQCELKVTVCSGQWETEGTTAKVPAFVRNTPTPTPTPTPRKTKTPTPKRTATPTPKPTKSIFGYTVLSGGTCEIISFAEKNKNGILTIPEKIDGHTVARIGNRVFKDCKGITEVVLPGKLREIGDEAFSGCVKLKAINLPQNIVQIGARAFYGCTSLKKISLPEKVRVIRDYSFYGCTNLSEFYTGGWVESIGEYAFKDSSIKRLSLPYGLKTIGKYAFSNCSKLSYVSLPNSLRNIGEHAFEYCSRLTGITIPKGITRIEEWTFYKSGLKSVELPKRLTYIGAMAFSDCPLTKVSIPASITYIDTTSFEYEVAYTVVKGSYAERFCKNHYYEYYYAK